MAEALYGPNGYYTSTRTILGSRGDFTTTPKLTKLLAKKIATWIESAWKRQGQNLPVIELGPGDGTLANDIGKSLGFFARRKMDYHFVDLLKMMVHISASIQYVLSASHNHHLIYFCQEFYNYP